MLAVTSKREQAIIESPAHPEASPGTIHADQWDDDEIEPACRKRSIGAIRDPDAKRPATGFPGQRTKGQSAMPPVDHDRNVQVHTAPPRRRDQPGGIDFAIERQIKRDPAAGGKLRQALDRFGGKPRASIVIPGSEGAPLRTELLTQGRFGGGFFRIHANSW